MKKYKILSTSAIFPMNISFKINSEEPAEEQTVDVNIRVDYSNEKIYFDDMPVGLDIDLVELEKSILDALRPEVEYPDFPKDLFDRVSQARSGGYADSLRNEGSK